MLRSLCVLLSLLLPSLVACSKDQPPPIGPAGKISAAQSDLPRPKNLRVDSITDTSALIAWDVVEGADDYDVSYKPLPDGEWTVWPHRGSATHTTLTGLSPEIEYRWGVKADRGSTKSRWTLGPNFTTLPAPIDTPPITQDTPTDTPASEDPINPPEPDTTVPGPGFDIDLVFLDRFSDTKLTARQRELFREAADRWEEVIVGDIEDVLYQESDLAWNGSLTYTFWVNRYNVESYVDTIRVLGHIDDVRIYVKVIDNPHNLGFIATASDITNRGGWEDDTWRVGFASSGIIRLYENHIPLDDGDFFRVALHEIGHIVGISHRGFLSSGYFRPLDTTGFPINTEKTYFVGPSALTYFDLMGGHRHKENKVPVFGFSHWHPRPLYYDIMSSLLSNEAGISLVTIGALADMGYDVDFSAADDVELDFWDEARKTVADNRLRCGVE